MHTNNQVTRYRSINYAYISMYYAYLSIYYAYTTRTVHVLINITSLIGHIAAGIAVSCTLKPLHISLHMLRI